jgi:hypothetical protein
LNQTFKQNDRIEQLQRQLIELQTENDRLKHESQFMVVNYSRQIDAKEDALRNLKLKLDALDSDHSVEIMVRRANETIKQENRMLREKVADLSRSLDLVQQDHHAPSVLDALESENRRLRADLVEKEREYSR